MPPYAIPGITLFVIINRDKSDFPFYFEFPCEVTPGRLNCWQAFADSAWQSGGWSNGIKHTGDFKLPAQRCAVFTMNDYDDDQGDIQQPSKEPAWLRRSPPRTLTVSLCLGRLLFLFLFCFVFYQWALDLRIDDISQRPRGVGVGGVDSPYPNKCSGWTWAFNIHQRIKWRSSLIVHPAALWSIVVIFPLPFLPVSDEIRLDLSDIQQSVVLHGVFWIIMARNLEPQSIFTVRRLLLKVP